MSVPGTVEETIFRYSMLDPGDHIGIAVSGGADSVCLLRVLHQLAPAQGWTLTVLHLDHRLRGEESREDAGFVAELASELKVPLVEESIDVATLSADRNLSLEEAGREARAAMYRHFLKSPKYKVATGHTLSDQAETVLFRLLRGTGLTGLSGISPATSSGLVRPLIALKRQEIRQWLQHEGYPWREDASNLSRDFDRNRIRLELMPLLAREWNPQIEESLARLATIAGAEEDTWAEIAQLDLAAVAERFARSWVLRVEGFWALRQSRQRRLLRLVFSQLLSTLRGIDLQHIEAARVLFEPNRGDGRLQIPGLDLMRSLDWVRICIREDAGPGDRFEETHAEPPCRLLIRRGRAQLSIESVSFAKDGVTPVCNSESQYNEGSHLVDATKLKGPLVLRCWRPGDRIRTREHREPVKLKALFQEFRIPIWERSTWPVLESGGDIIWASRFGTALEYAATDECEHVLQVKELDLPNIGADGMTGGELIESKHPTKASEL